MKEKALNDVTNKLEPKPAKLKPLWTGSKSSSGTNMREVGPVSQLIAHGPESRSTAGGPGAPVDKTLKGGPLPCRPPDPLHSINSSTVLEGMAIPKSKEKGVSRVGSGGEAGAREASHDGRDVAMAEEAAEGVENQSNYCR